MAGPRPILVVFGLLASLGWAGCLAPGSGSVVEELESPPSGSDLPESTVEVTQKPLPSEAPVDPKEGVMQGVVVNQDNISIDNAFVALLETENSTRSDGQGRFAILGIPAGTYTLRVDAQNYKTLEENVVVVANEITDVTVRLAFVEEIAIGFREHFHDLWNGEERRTVFEGKVHWPTSFAHGGEQPAAASIPGCAKVGNTQISPKFSSGCWSLPVKMDQNVFWPGTKEIIVNLKWKQDPAVPSMKFSFATANASVQHNAPTPAVFNNGESKTFAIQPSEADHGHAKFTAWAVSLVFEYRVAAGTVALNHGDVIRSQLGPVDVKIEAVKGEVPPEQPHARYWLGGPSIQIPEFKVVVSEDAARDPTYYYAYPYAYSSSGPHMMIPFNPLVPPGTTRLNVSLTYASGTSQLDPHLSKKTLAFRTAELYPASTTLTMLRVETPLEKATGVAKYSLQVKPEATDQFYQKRSFWLFLLANEGKERDPEFKNECSTGCGGATYKISLEAINENWLEDFRAGRV